MSNRHYTVTEIRTIKRFAGVKSTQEIADDLGRSKASVVVQAMKHKVSLRMHGEDHYNAVLSNMHVQMIDALVGCGFTCAEIHINLFPQVSRNTVYAVVQKYNRKVC